MKIYLVGGAVRDELCANKPKDLDYVVVGSSREEMISLGYTPSGLDFEVFRNSKGEEFALARRERKVAPGSTGFVTEVNDVTLEEDLRRRDFTINAMAKDLETNEIIDPFGGRADLVRGVLRHVDDVAFGEDPLRVVRMARFAARGFSIAHQTMKLAKEIAARNDMTHISGNRYGIELRKLFEQDSATSPSVFFYVLKAIGALEHSFPEIHNLIGVIQPELYHPEGDVFIHTMEVLDVMYELSSYQPTMYRQLALFSALTHDLGKATTPKDILPHHHGHEIRGVYLVREMVDRLGLSAKFRKVAGAVAKYHTHMHNFHSLRNPTIVDMFDDLKVHSHPEILDILADIGIADTRGRSPVYRNADIPNNYIIKKVFGRLYQMKQKFVLANYPTLQDKDLKTLKGEQIKEAVRRHHIEAVATMVKQWKEQQH